MATQAQIDANRRNAQASTGPKTEAGKANSSRNATRFGLFSTHNCVLPGEEEIYDHLCHSLWDELAPVGTIEEVTAAEYVRAIWLLRRCAVAAESLGMYVTRQCNEDNRRTGKNRKPVGPMLADDCLRNEAAIARARAQADNSRRRAKADLDKLQAERRARTPELQTEAAKPEPVPAPVAEALEEKAPITEPSQPACGSTPQFAECCGADGPLEPSLDRAA
jgi:hypothetical protein